MKTFFLMHALYLAGGITAYLIQFIYNNRILRNDWTRYDSFKAAMISFFSWVYVLAFGIMWCFSKMAKEFSTLKGMYK
ncbi:MAG: hypothetical protein WKF97_24430 [Chitinophagaceae bacterium]